MRTMKALKIDLDLHDARKRYAAVRRVGFYFALFEELHDVAIVGVECHRTRHGVHIEAWVGAKHEIADEAIVAMQAICGSDGVREALNLRRLRDAAFRGTGSWNVLFDERVKEHTGRAPDRYRAKAAPELTAALTKRMEGYKRAKASQ